MKPYLFIRKTMMMVFKPWAEPLVKNYREPTRAGTPKGKNIGLSRSKYLCALLQALHGPFSLAELSEVLFSFEIKGIIINGASPGQIRLWRTEEQFRDVAKWAIGEFAIIMLQEVQKYIGKKQCIDKNEVIIGLLFLEVLVNLPGYKTIKDRLIDILSGYPQYLVLFNEIIAEGTK